jgi:Domain of unknown function (DUF6458)
MQPHRRTPGRTIAAAPAGWNGQPMTIGAALFSIAVGAILRFAVTADFAGIDIDIVGTILMIVGVVGLVLGLVLMNTARSRRSAPPPPRY